MIKISSADISRIPPTPIPHHIGSEKCGTTADRNGSSAGLEEHTALFGSGVTCRISFGRSRKGGISDLSEGKFTRDCDFAVSGEARNTTVISSLQYVISQCHILSLKVVSNQTDRQLHSLFPGASALKAKRIILG